MRRRSSLHAVLLVPALLLVAACGSSGTEVAVTATESACQVTDTELTAGTYSFAATNSTSKELELYVYGQQDGAFTKVVAEAEHIAPGTTRKAKAKLAAGEYELACKAEGDEQGNRTKVTVK